MRYSLDGAGRYTLDEVFRSAPTGGRLREVLRRDLPRLRGGDRVLVSARDGEVLVDALGEPVGEPVGEPLPEWARRAW